MRQFWLNCNNFFKVNSIPSTSSVYYDCKVTSSIHPYLLKFMSIDQEKDKDVKNMGKYFSLELHALEFSKSSWR